MNGNFNLVASLHWLSFPRVSPPCCRLSLSSSLLHLALLHFPKTSPERNPLQRRCLLLPFWFREPGKERTEKTSLSIQEAGSWSVCSAQFNNLRFPNEYSNCVCSKPFEWSTTLNSNYWVIGVVGISLPNTVTSEVTTTWPEVRASCQKQIKICILSLHP